VKNSQLGQFLMTTFYSTFLLIVHFVSRCLRDLLIICDMQCLTVMTELCFQRTTAFLMYSLLCDFGAFYLLSIVEVNSLAIILDFIDFSL